MAEIKKRILSFSNGKIIKLYGNSIAIGKSLEISEAYAPNILGYYIDPGSEKASPVVANPHKLTVDEIQELADYNIRLWMELKDNLRKHGIASTKIFNREAML
jgi:hypothetical protein